MKLPTIKIRIAWLNCFPHLELSKGNRLILKRTFSVRQKQFTPRERAVLLRTILCLIPSKRDVLFQSNLSFILASTPFSEIEPLLSSFPSKPVPDVLLDELLYRPLTPDSLLLLLYFASEGVPSLPSKVQSLIRSGQITHSLYAEAVAGSSVMTSPLLECFFLLAAEELRREYESLERWAVSQTVEYWRDWYRTPCLLCDKDQSTFCSVLMQLAERKDTPEYYRIFSLVLLNRCRNGTSQQVFYSLRNHFHTLPKVTVSWYCYILRDYQDEMDWILEVDDFTSISLIRQMKLPLKEWISCRSSHSQDLDVIAERSCMGFALHADWCCSIEMIAREFERRIGDLNDSCQVLEVFGKLRRVARICEVAEHSDVEDVYLLLFEAAWFADQEKEEQFLRSFDLLIPWMKREKYAWMQSVQFLSFEFVKQMNSSLKWKCLCYSEMYWNEDDMLRMLDEMTVSHDLYECVVLLRLCNRVGKHPQCMDCDSDDLSMKLVYQQLNPSDAEIISLLEKSNWAEFDHVAIPKTLCFFVKSTDVSEAVLTLLSLLQSPESFKCFYSRDIIAADDSEAKPLLPSEKRKKYTDFESMMKHVEYLAACEASSQSAISPVFPCVTSSNELHFVLTCVDVCTLRFSEARFLPSASDWLSVIVSLIQGMNSSLRKKMKKDKMGGLVVERVIEVFLTYLHCVLVNPSEYEERRQIVERIRSCGFESKSLKEALQCVDSVLCAVCCSKLGCGFQSKFSHSKLVEMQIRCSLFWSCE